MAAIAEILRVGYASMTVAQVAQNCDVTASAVTNRFRNKNEIVDAIIAEVAEVELGAMFTDQVNEFWEGAEFWGGDTVQGVGSREIRPGFELVGLIGELMIAALHSPEIKTSVGNFIARRSVDALYARDRAIAAGRVREGQNPQAQSSIGTATLIGHYVASLTSPPPPGVGIQLHRLTQMSVLKIDLDTPFPKVLADAPRPTPETPDLDLTLEFELDDIGRDLIDAARRVISEVGHERAKLQEIARAAGMTTGAIYSRFDSKSDLLRAVAIHSMGPGSGDPLRAIIDLTNRASEDGTPGGFVELLPMITDPSMADHRALRIALRSASRSYPELAKTTRAIQEHQIRTMASAFEGQQRAGTFREDLSPDALAWWLVSLPAGANLLADVFPQRAAADWTSIFQMIQKIIRTQPRS